MRAETKRVSGQFRLILLTFPLALIPLVLIVLLPPDGSQRSELAQFIGRFHLVAVHFPIALILLVPVLELTATNSRFSFLRLSATFVLGLAATGAVVAAILGWLLARSGGYSGPLLTQHMWGGTSLAFVCWLCWAFRVRGTEAAPGRTYVLALLAGVFLVSWVGYRGGQLSLGEDHLTEHMPAVLRSALGVSPFVPASVAVADARTFYGARVQPIFSARCVSCHGPAKHRGNLRLDSYGALMRGGKDGPVVRAGDVSGSDLFRRVNLPPGRDDYMPKEGKQPLSPDQLKVIELWIGAGVSPILAVDAIKDAPVTSPSATVADVVFEEVDSASVTKMRTGAASTVEELKKRFPNILDYESRTSASLYLNASLLGSNFTDDDLAALAPIADQITIADLSRTAITDRSVTAIVAMKHLRVLKLMKTGISDTTLQRLDALDQLESLNVFGTRVTAAAMPSIEKLPRLAHFYAGQTSIPHETTIPKGLAGKVVF